MPYVHRLRPNRDVIAQLIADRFEGNISKAARAAGLGHATLHDILAGRREGREETLGKLAAAFDVPLSVITVPVLRGAA